MKTKILLVVLCIIMLSCKSITETQTINYNFSKGEFNNVPIKPVQGQPVVLKIEHINNLFYKVNIESKDIAIQDKNLFDEERPKSDKSPEPSEPKKLDSPVKIENEIQKSVNKEKFEDRSNKELSKKITEIEKQIENNSTLLKAKKFERDNVMGKIENINKQLSSMESSDDLKAKIDSLKPENDKMRAEVQKKIEKRNKLDKNQANYESEIKSINAQIAEYVNKNDMLNSELKKITDQDKTAKEIIVDYLRGIKKMYADLYLSANQIYKINDNYNSYIDKVLSPELTLEEYTKIKNNAELENAVILKEGKLNECNSEINLFDNIKTNLLMKLNDVELDKIKDLLTKLSDGQSLITKLNDDISTVKKDINDLSKTVNDLNIRKKLNYVEGLNRILSNPETYIYTSPPIQGYEDYLKFDVNITGKKAEDGKYIIDRSKLFEYKEYLKGGVRFDFSIGTVFDIGSKQQEYEIQQINNDFKIVQKTNNKYIPTIAGMLHTSWRSSSNFAFGFTFGISMDMTKLQLNSLFPGISLLVGKTDKIIFTTGPALRKISELKYGYEANQFVSSSSENYLTDSYKLGWFIGVSWNLTNKQKSLMRLAY
ncbi:MULTISPECIES: coiled-coil domain-containing protein [unclassified Chryseobacterium]|uniref:coiled-coil domain-containing protein n=1 Tax=unclassified Chryseobacterium TaxID=2593645 RepID=UPI0030172FC1